MKKAAYTDETWGCGYSVTDQKFSYTATSFAATITELFGFILKKNICKNNITEIFQKNIFYNAY